MSKDNPIKNHQYKSGELVNLNGRSKGSLGGKKVVKKYLAFLQEEVNPSTGIKELLRNEDMIKLTLIHKAKKGDVNTYKALMDSAYGAVKQSVEVTEGETPIFKQLDIDVIE
tara:strand:+ start:3120 stop:3455 length:336 start_codon:yes stop_codon:yes gene_type:complete